MKIDYAIIFVSDMAKSVSFYKDVLGFPLKFESKEWTEFAGEGATLALHISDKAKPDVQQQKYPGQCIPGFQVKNLDEFHKKMISNSVVCKSEPRDVFGSKIAQYVDPDGLIFSVGETH